MKLIVRILAITLFSVSMPPVARSDGPKTGNVIFVHPDGAALNHWQIARMYWKGPDGALNWDLLPEMNVYRGHMSDRLTGTSNGGATAHAFGFKPQAQGSFGTDRGMEFNALSGFPGSIMRQAACSGIPVGVVNDGNVANEPGTGAFLAELRTRGFGQDNEAARQLIHGRPLEDSQDCDPGTSDQLELDQDPVVILGGGESLFLPSDAPQCTVEPDFMGRKQLDCFVHRRPHEVTDPVPTQLPGTNLLTDADADGWLVIRTRKEFDALAGMIGDSANCGLPAGKSKVLGLFASDHTFNDEEEERLASEEKMPTAGGLVRGPDDPLPPEGEEFGAAKIGRLVLWGPKHGDPNNPFGSNPPTAAEMTEMALKLLACRAGTLGKPFFLVTEIESTDNFSNQNNAIGSLRALKRADDTIAVARDFAQRAGVFAEYEERADTLILVAADSDAAGMQAISVQRGDAGDRYNPVDCGIEIAADTDPGDVPEASGCTAGETRVNSNGRGDNQETELDGIEGRRTAPFSAEPDALQNRRPFARGNDFGEDYGGISEPGGPLTFVVGWSGINDTAGGVLARAEGLNAALIHDSSFSTLSGFDNTDVYRLLYKTLFSIDLPKAIGRSPQDELRSKQVP